MPEKRGLEEESGASEEAGVKRVCPEPENGRPGDWLCPNCQHHNWSFRDVCQKCNTNKDGVKQAAGSAPQGGKPGDWNCPGCAHLNYAFRHSCQRCHTPKPYNQGEGPPGAENSRPGDWTCPTCGDLVYASRHACRKCNTPKMMGQMMGMPGMPGMGGQMMGMPPMGGQMGAGAGQMGGGYGNQYGMDPMAQMNAMGMQGGKPGAAPKETRAGDWSCPKCFDINYASRSVCRLCNTPKAMADPSAAFANMYGYDMSQAYGDMSQAYGFSMGVSGGMGQQGGSGKFSQRRAGDWDCPSCGDVVYASRSECRKCKTGKPDHLGPTASNPHFNKPINNGLGPSRRAGDWDCPSCGDVQYASRTECRKCRTAKPDI